jgi:pyruvate kinase
VQAQMAVVWGVRAAMIPKPKDTDSAMHAALQVFLKAKCLKKGDLAILTAGVPLGAGKTNMIQTKVV